MANNKHQPKGGMCVTCADSLRDCSGLLFSEMKPIKTYSDGVIAVRCTSHVRAKAAGGE
jgi:hypothetical protein